jgi:hypothetical protein
VSSKKAIVLTARALGARREFIHQFRGGLFVRQRDIQALEAGREQAQRIAPKTIGAHVE